LIPPVVRKIEVCTGRNLEFYPARPGPARPGPAREAFRPATKFSFKSVPTTEGSPTATLSI